MSQNSVLFGDRAILKSSDKDAVEFENKETVNQIEPMKYPWAWDYYRSGAMNNWSPQEIAMGEDKLCLDSGKLTEQELLLFKKQIGQFACLDTIVSDHVALSVLPYINNPEIRQMLYRQIAEEAIHAESYQHIPTSLGMDTGEVFNYYRQEQWTANKCTSLLINNFIARERLKNKEKPLQKIIEEVESEVVLLRGVNKINSLFESNLDMLKMDDQKKMMSNLLYQYVAMEGIHFYCGFVLVFSLQRQGKMVRSGEQVQYIMRDESLHFNFGIDLINQIKLENPHLWDDEMKRHARKLVKEAVHIETEFARHSIGGGVLGVTIDSMSDYLQFIADRRLEQLGLAVEFHSNHNPFLWMSEMVDIKKEKNFFESRVTEYKVGSNLNWDE